MNLIDRFTARVESLNRRMLASLLKVGLPRYGKRLVFVVSLFAGLKHDAPVVAEDLMVLNDELQLASCHEALEFPASISGNIWNQCDLDAVGCQRDIDNSSRALVEQMPMWLRYSTFEKMVEDAKEVIRLVRPVVA